MFLHGKKRLGKKIENGDDVTRFLYTLKNLDLTNKHKYIITKIENISPLFLLKIKPMTMAFPK